MKIISGGQTGADIAGVKVAKLYGFKTGGYMPKGYMTRIGLKPEYKKLYKMEETKTADYPTRTGLNVKESDCTIWFGEKKFSAGKLCTFKYVKMHKKPYKDIDINNPLAIEIIVEWLILNNYKIINIAGNSQTATNNMEQRVSDYLNKLFFVLISIDSNNELC